LPFTINNIYPSPLKKLENFNDRHHNLYYEI
jgi:hypothetical protein